MGNKLASLGPVVANRTTDQSHSWRICASKSSKRIGGLYAVEMAIVDFEVYRFIV
jgi:hypothetical protein